jgi:uncharacterized membrane protein YfcA
MDLFTTDAGSILLASLLIGIVVGLTGMGGGALLTPALIFLGVNPTAAVANDLVASGMNRTVGAAVHWRQGSPHRGLVKWLVIGSVPTAFAGAFIVDAIGAEDTQEDFLRLAIGVALLITAATYTLRLVIQLREVAAGRAVSDDDPPVRVGATLAVGIIGGFLVGITSVGAGSLMMVSLLLLYPTLHAVKIVGTDLAQAVPLVVAAAASHVIVSGVDWAILIPLVVGGTPGTFVGARLAHRVSQAVIRRSIVILLSVTGLAMLGLDPVLTILAGVLLVVVGPLVWGQVRRWHGLPAFRRLGRSRAPVGSLQSTTEAPSSKS